jgi:hypothetical protein
MGSYLTEILRVVHDGISSQSAGKDGEANIGDSVAGRARGEWNAVHLE